MYNLEEIKKDLRMKLSDYRYNHSLSVALVCIELANIYNVDKDKAYVVGLVHDIAKEFSDEENIYYIEKYNLPRVDDEFKRIVHGEVGAAYLREKYNMDDEVCEAVRVHSIGSTDMTMLDKILFVADKIEPGKDYPGIEDERRVAKEDIDKALLLCLENNYKQLIGKGRRMHPISLEVLDNLKKANRV